MKTIGIIGGLGPESTCEFYRLITRYYYDRYGDYNYPEIIIYSVSEKSRRSAVHCIDDLQNKGAQGIVLGCTELPFLISQKDVSIPVFDTTALYAHKALDLALE